MDREIIASVDTRSNQGMLVVVRYNLLMSGQEQPIRNLILDMDGVLWHRDRPVPGLKTFFDELERLKIGFVLATNNARKIARQYSEKLAGYGIDVPPEQILTSAEATARYLAALHPEGLRVYVVGDNGLRLAMAEQGFQVIEHDGFVGPDASAGVVVVGFTPYFCYDHLASATYLINRGAQFVGTNPDVTYPTEYGPMPGAGSMIHFLKTATNVEPVVLGKPNAAIFEQALKRLGSSRHDTVMVGDRLSTDIKGGQAAGMRTILLLSGISNMEDVAGSDVKPDWIFDDLAALTRFIAMQSEQMEP
jgi:4-nitrophenyl phosphatase